MFHARVGLVAYIVLGLVVVITGGFFWALPLMALAAVFIGLTAVCLAWRPSAGREGFPTVLRVGLAVVLAICGVALWISPSLVYPTATQWAKPMEWAQSALLASTFLVVVGSVLSRGATPDAASFARLTWAGAALAAVSLVALRLFTLWIDPAPRIDVFVTNTLACDHLLAGKNPYSATYPDVYRGAYQHQPGFFYWPGVVYALAPFRGLLGDIRYGTLAADVLAAGLLVVAARRYRWPPLEAALLGLLWLAMPVSLLVLEQAWIDPLLVTGIGLLAAALGSRWWIAAGIAAGWIAATKQYGGLVGLVTLVHLLAVDRRAGWKMLASAAATWMLLVLPLALGDLEAFYRNTLSVYASAGVRDDSLALPALAHRLGWKIPAWYGSLVGGGACVALLAWCAIGRSRGNDLRDWSAALACGYGLLFLFGKFAFCNYYYLVAFFLLLLVMSCGTGPAHSAGDRTRHIQV